MDKKPKKREQAVTKFGRRYMDGFAFLRGAAETREEESPNWALII
jgi:hypothetical protein